MDEIKQKQLTLVFPSKTQYTITKTYNCTHLDNLMEFNTDDLVYIKEDYEDIFKNNILTQQVELSDSKSEEQLMIGLAYFGCSVLMKELYEKQRKRRKEELEEEVSDLLFREYEWYNRYRGISCIKNPRLLTDKFVKKYFKAVSLENAVISEEIMKNKLGDMKGIDWECLCENSNFSEQFFRDILQGPYKDKLYWNTLCRNPTLSVQFFKDMLKSPYKDKLNWNTLCLNTNLSEQFFREILKGPYKDKIDWDTLCRNSSISEQFYRENMGKLDWDSLCYNSNVSDEFLFQCPNPEDLSWFGICSFSKRSDTFFQYYIKYIRIYWQELAQNRHISEQFFRDNSDRIPWYAWKYLSEHPNISEQFLRENIDKIELTTVGGNPNISEQFLEDYKDQIGWGKITLNRNISENTIRKYYGKKGRFIFCYDYLLCNNNLSEEFFLDYPNVLKYGRKECLGQNNNLSPQFIIEHGIMSSNFFNNNFKRYIERTLDKEFDLKFT